MTPQCGGNMMNRRQGQGQGSSSASGSSNALPLFLPFNINANAEAPSILQADSSLVAPEAPVHPLAPLQLQQSRLSLASSSSSSSPGPSSSPASRSSLSAPAVNSSGLYASHNEASNAHNVALQAAWGWQGNKASVLDRLNFLLHNDLLSDITFLVGKPEPAKIIAHKFILSMGSAVFDAMFNGPLATKEREIRIPDIEPQAFSSLLKFLYTDEVGDISHYSVMTTLYAAKKYAVPALQTACVDFLKRNLRPDNAFLLVTQARLFDETDLANLCMETIDQHTSEAIVAEGFFDLDYETLCSVLERDTLHIRENMLFAAVSKWAEHECGRQGKSVDAASKREVLDTALELIRFPVMTIEEFAQGPAQSGLLTDKEVKELFLYYTLNPKPETRFLCIPRSCLAGKEYICTRFQSTDNRWGYSGTADRIRFTVDRQIFVMGLGVYGSVHGPAEYAVTMAIMLSSNQRVLAQHDTSFASDGTESVFRVMFKKPVEIQLGVHYTLSACLKGPDSFYGTRGVRKVTKQIGKESSVTFNFIYSPGNNNGTSVEDGQIPEIIYCTI